MFQGGCKVDKGRNGLIVHWPDEQTKQLPRWHVMHDLLEAPCNFPAVLKFKVEGLPCILSVWFWGCSSLPC